MHISNICQQCGNLAGSLHMRGEEWVCKHCFKGDSGDVPYFKEMGVENPGDPKGSTAHVRDIKNRRYDSKTDKTYYHQPKKTYFFPKGA